MPIFETKLGDDPVTVVAPTAAEFDPAAFRAAFPPGGLYGLDVEGTYMGDLGQFDPDFEIRLIQFATVDYALVLDLADPVQQDAAIRLLSDQGVSFASHTPMDVLAVWTRLGVDITGRNVDTHLLARMAHPDARGGLDLKTLASRHGMPQLAEHEQRLEEKFRQLWKAAGGRAGAAQKDIAAYGWSAISTADEPYLVYAGLDAIACRRLAGPLAAATGAPPALVELDVWLAGQANRIQIRGMRVDTGRLDALAADAQQIAAEVHARVASLTGGLPPLSPKLRPREEPVTDARGRPLKAQDGRHRRSCTRPGCTGCATTLKRPADGWLAAHGVDWATWPGDHTDTGTPSLEKDNLLLLRGYPLDDAGRHVVEQLIRYRQVHDQLNKTNGVRAVLDRDGRIHPTLKSIGTVTGRMSSTGPNFQNFSKKNPELRGMFLPDPGHTLVTADFDQVELRVVAALARETKMIDTILAGGDLHQLTVDELAAAGISIDRDTAKMTNFLIVYGGGAPALSSQAGIPLGDAQRIVDTHRRRYPAVQRLTDRMSSLNVIVNIAGRRIPPGVDRKTGRPRPHANVNYLVQSSARELLVHAWKRFADEFGRADLVWFPIHDELVLHVPNGLVEQVMAEVEQCMRFDFMSVPISASAVPLREQDGTSRWMTSKQAEKYAKLVMDR